MSKSDEIDRRRAAAFAWRFIAPDAEDPEAGLEQLSKDLEAQADNPGAWDGGEPADDDDEDEFLACEMLSDAVNRIWAFTDGAAQAEAVDALLGRAADLSSRLNDMQGRPLQSVRLLRLAVRHLDRLSPVGREDILTIAQWLDYDHPEIFDLLAEVAHADNMEVVHALRTELGKRKRVIRRHPDAGARLARMLDRARTVRARYVVMRWLSLAIGPEVIGPLRRVLRQRCYSLRFHALELLEKSFPHAVQADDLLFLLQEAADRMPPLYQSRENHDTRHSFPDLLTRAVVRVRPEGGHVPLERILDGDCAYRNYSCGLTDTWALCTLAAAYPEHAVARIDALYRNADSSRRHLAVQAASRLPDELAWPRLLSAAADGRPEIAEHAREAWLERRGSLCPVDELAGVQVELLEGPPSERMRSRLAMLRTGSREARSAMAEVLLSEAPDPEALVLLLFAAVDDQLWYYQKRSGLPSSIQGLCAAIISGFGVRGVQGLCELAARYPEAYCGWLYWIAGLLTDKRHDVTLPEAAYPLLRAAVVRRLADPSVTDFRFLPILTVVGTPPELFERLWSIAREPAELEHRPQGQAADALAAMLAGQEDRDRTVLAEMEAALAASELLRFARAATVGVRCGLSAAVSMVERALEDHGAAEQDDLAVTNALEICVWELKRAERLPEGWLAAALTRPGTQAFAAAARAVPNDASFEAALQSALGAESSVAAAEAACALSKWWSAKKDVETIVDIALRAPLVLGAKIVLFMVLMLREDMPRSVWPLIERILTSTDSDATSYLRRTLLLLSEYGFEQEIMAIGSRIVDPEMWKAYREWHGLQRGDNDYWEDAELLKMTG